jgi:glycosyltransferase involved in cell wall biosynthesis
MEKKLPDITILMSTYNRQKYLPIVLKDLQEQTLSNWKLIVVNDGGDDVEDIVAGFSDSRMEYHNRQHAGKAAQLNYALNLVESKYIGYLDDDDRVMPNHYELLYNAAEKNGAEFIYSNVQPVVRNYNDDSIVEEWPVNDEDIGWSDIRLHNKINHSTILHTKSLAEKVGGYDERMKVLIDFDYIKRLASFAKPNHVHATTYQWNLRQDKFGRIQTISGLWEREPEESGRSLMAFFEKDLASLAICYQEHAQIKGLRQQVINLEAERSRSMLSKQFADMQRQMNELRAVSYAKGRKHLRIIRLLLWLDMVIILFVVAYMFS